MVERDFTQRGEMRPASKEQRRALEGYLPFYSVDTREEADALVAAALDAGEFMQSYPGGPIIETTLAEEQTLDNLRQAGVNLMALHEKLAIQKDSE